jgi:molybdopterin/thiamine biosynthesis adenylyltransferase
VECAAETLRRFKPEIEIEAVDANVTEENAADLVGRADVVFGCAPLFEERFLMNRECVRAKKLLVDCAMYALEGRVMVISPGLTPCLSCLFPEVPPHWKRRFPVLGAVSALVAQIGVLEAIKRLTGLGESTLGEMIVIDTAAMRLDRLRLAPARVDCPVCGRS